jgi:hypothetical protein
MRIITSERRATAQAAPKKNKPPARTRTWL